MEVVIEIIPNFGVSCWSGVSRHFQAKWQNMFLNMMIAGLILNEFKIAAIDVYSSLVWEVCSALLEGRPWTECLVLSGSVTALLMEEIVLLKVNMLDRKTPLKGLKVPQLLQLWCCPKNSTSVGSGVATTGPTLLCWLNLVVWWRVHSSTRGTSRAAETRGENQGTWIRSQTAPDPGNKIIAH